MFDRLSHLLNSIDSFDNPDLAFDHHEARHRSDSRRELTEALGQATTAVDTMTNDALFLHHDASIVEESQRVMSTWTIMRDMAAEKLQHGSQIKDHSAALSPMRTSNHDIRADRPPSQISMASVASSRIPRMRSTADLRVSRSERRPRPASPSAASVLSEAPTNFTNTSLTTRITKSSTHSHLPRRNPQTTPRHMRTSTSSKTLHTPDFRRNLSTRSLSEKLEKPRYSPASKRAVDQEVARVVNSMNFKRSIPIRSSDDTFDQSGRYYIGNRIYFVRILRSRIVMVRVGGGWQELRAFLKTHFSHLLVDQGDVSVLVPRSPNTPRSASLSLSRKSDVSVGGSPDLLKILSSPLGGSPVQRIRSVT